MVIRYLLAIWALISQGAPVHDSRVTLFLMNDRSRCLVNNLRSRTMCSSSTRASSLGLLIRHTKYRANALRSMVPSSRINSGNLLFSRTRPLSLSPLSNITVTCSPGKKSCLNS